MHVDPVVLRAFERETAGVLEPALRSWALQALMAGLEYEDRLQERNRALRAALDWLPPERSMAEKVRTIRGAMLAAGRSVKPAHPGVDSFAGCIALALLARDKVPNERQLRDILDV